MKMRTPRWTLILLCLSALLVVGCEMERRVVKRTGWSAVFNPDNEWYEGPDRGSSASDPSNRRNKGFAIELGRYTGAEAFHGVHNLMQTARQDAGLANLWYTTVGTEATVYMGRFKDDDSSEARAALKKVRAAEVNGKELFPNAKLVKLNAEKQGEVLDPRDVRTLKGKGRFTLQIGYYDREYGPDFRRAAETAVDVLRDNGENAFYYHGPHRSMVLLNAWTYGEAFTLEGTTDRYSNAVRLTQEKYPHNVPNGRKFQPGDDPAYVKSQHSFLVPIR